MPSTRIDNFTASVAAVAARTNTSGAAVDDFTAEEARLLIGSILNQGWLSTNAFKVNPNAPAAMSVLVGSGTAKADRYVVAGTASGQGSYIVRLDQTTVTVTIDAADPSQSRTDEIWLVVRDNAYDAQSRTLPQIGYRKGDPGAGAPGADSAWKAAVKLATVTVPAAASTIVAGNITDNRTRASLTVGGATVWDATNDGPGSGLDADTLDGVQASGFVTSSAGKAFDADKLDGFDLPVLLHEMFRAGSALDDSPSGSASSTTFVHAVETTFTRPSGWNTYDIYAWGAAAVATLPATPGASSAGVRIEIGSDNGTPLSSDTTNTESREVGVVHQATGLSGASQTLAVAYRRESGETLSVIADRAWLMYFAVRRS